MLNLTVQPVGSRNGRYVPKFLAFLGERLLTESKTPLLTSARILLAEGVHPDTVITMTHRGSSVVAMRSTVEAAAGLVVEETETRGPRFRKYHPLNPSEIPQEVGRWSPRTAISNRHDAIPSETTMGLPESAFEDDLCL